MQIVQAPRASAIIYSLLANLENRNPWLLPANICPIVPITFLKARIPFKFVDISAKTLHMDLDQAESLIRKRNYGGLLYAHTYGESSTPNEFFESIKNFFPELTIIDDRCLCVPDVELDPANKADVQLYSTGYAKIVDLNFGGYSFLGQDIRYQATRLPFNPRDNEQVEKSYKDAISQQVKFIYQDCDWLDTETPPLEWHDYKKQIEMNLVKSLEHRAQLNQIYATTLPVELQLPHGFQTWRFNICVKNQQHILERIFSSGFFASSHYVSLANIMDEDQAPYAQALAERVVNLFNDDHLAFEQVEQICNIILENLA